MNQEYKVGIYLRLSREDEKLGESGSITNQRLILMNYIKDNNLCFIKEYVDDGVSGTTFDREGFNQMIKDIENKKINMVITKDTSRLGRDHIEFGFYVEKYFPEHRIRYVAVCDNIDTFYNNNDMLLFKSAYNDMYVKDISNKIRASLTIKKKNGQFIGAYAPYGYIKDPNNKHKLIIDKKSSLIVKRIFKMFVEGNSITRIMNTLTQEEIPIPSVYKKINRGLRSSIFGVWTQRTITDILTNPTYMGNMTQGRSKKISYKTKKRIHTPKEDWIIKENSCPAIIDETLFAMAQNIYYSNKNRYSQTKKENNLLLRGIIYCQECNHTIGFRKVSNKIYGNCNYYLKHRHQQACTPHSVLYQDIEKQVINKCNALLKNINKEKLINNLTKDLTATSSITKTQETISKLERDIININWKLDKAYEDKLDKIISPDRYTRISTKLIQESNQLTKEINDLKEKIINQKDTDWQVLIEEKLNTYQINRLLITNLIGKITLSEDGYLSIYYKIKK